MVINTKAKKYVQSCVTTVSFPDTINGVFNMVNGNKKYASWATDFDTLLNHEKEKPLFWTAPKWLTEGDIMFFYLAKRAKTRINRLFSEVQERFPKKKNLIRLLRQAKDFADARAGSIFACAVVSGSTQLFEERNKHFISRLFAPIDEVKIFAAPLKEEAFSDCLRIGLNTITPLYKKEFCGIKSLLAENNELPVFLQESALGNMVFRNVSDENWRSISCSSDTKFIDEGQLRSYLIDFFLDEIKDERTTVLEECDCFRGSRNVGRADYFFKLFGYWIPVEAKLDLCKERNLLSQTAKYLNINTFVPRKGYRRNQIFETTSVPFCLVLDSSGLYLISCDNEFIDSELGKPKWKREQLAEIFSSEAREALRFLMKT